MSNTAAAVAVTLLSATAFGLASALQHEQAGEVPPSASASLLVALARRPRWLAGMAADVVGVALQAVALGLGTVALVQPLLVAGLPLAVALSAWLAGRRLQRREVAGVALTTLGLALIGPSTATTSDGHDPTRRDGLLAALLLGAVVAVLLAVARRRPRWAPATAGTAAGITVGGGAVLLAVSAGRVGELGQLVSSLAPYAALAVGGLGLLLSQAAFQTGSLGAPLAALSVAEPLVAVGLAVTVLQEQLPTTTPARLGMATGTALAVVGVVVLCRSGGHGAEQPDP